MLCREGYSRQARRVIQVAADRPVPPREAHAMRNAAAAAGTEGHSGCIDDPATAGPPDVVGASQLEAPHL